MHGKTVAVAIIALVIGFGFGFVLRPAILPIDAANREVSVNLPLPSAVPRGTQYFAANLEKARSVVDRCRDGSVRGDECANAETAIVEAEGRERFEAFMGR
ncbi:Putative membrane protein [Sphingopyxis fribergensis]|uniref:Uncharacterized protein n=2 Tax=Sphingomonadales TaxID=204457 RepID=A0A3A1P9F8_9SPHN|nr:MULTISPECIES: hypothetical protein [Sphingomonadales]AJA10904.1 Putative membrane protein [Sphingopyxis fribergensis]RIV90195.1 hypothetical protein D2V17_04740 [Aurantiacibacter xanthus]